ncbi:MAG: hypothetical protein OXE58_11330 [Acidobacteria bacterium]|nr:hypothetical protein [Acidobacteriota bacterium]
MTVEDRKHREGLRPGLPRILSEDSDRLKDLLGLNRKERRFMASLVPSGVRAAVRERLRNRAEPEKPGEEERLLGRTGSYVSGCRTWRSGIPPKHAEGS